MNSGNAVPSELPRRLGLLDSVSIVMGTVIGAGIFIVPGTIARELPSIPLILAVWMVTGIASFFGALAYAELGAMLPGSGGQYVYLREAYGPLPAFLCGWSFFLVIQSGSIATVAVGFGLYFSYLAPWIPGVSMWAPPLLIAILTGVNYRGVRAGAGVQVTFTALKLLGLAILMGAALFARPVQMNLAIPVEAIAMRNVGIAMLGCFVAYDGWHVIAFIAGEVRRPGRNLPLALAIGVSAVIAIYLLVNLAYLRVLTVAEVGASPRVAASAAERSLGPTGATLVTLTILLSTIGACNGSIMTAPRIYFAQARDGLFFRELARIHPKFETPSFSILVQGVWTMLLALSGSYEALFTYVMFISWAVHAMTVLSVIVLRRKRPGALRPYRMWGYPVTPLLFVGFAAWFIANTLLERPASSLSGLFLIAAGVPTYHFWRRRTMGLLAVIFLAASVCPAQTPFEADLGRGLTLVQQGKFAEAVPALTAAAKLKPESFEANYLMGIALSQTGRRMEAIRHLRAAHDAQARHTGVLTALGLLYLEEGFPLDAAEALEQAAKQSLLAEPAALMLIQAHHDSFDFERALRLASETAVRFPASPNSRFRLGYELETAGRFDEARSEFERALQLRPDFAEAHVAMGRLELHAGRYERARGHLEAAVRVQPKQRQARIELAKALLGLKQYGGAKELLARVVAESDTTPEPHLLLSRIHQAEGDEAAAALERARFLELSSRFSEPGGMSANVPGRKLRRFVP